MRWWGKERFRFLQRQAGFSLMEAVVAVGIISLIGIGIVAALDTNYRATRTLDEQVTAVNMVTAYLEAVREIPYSNDYSSAEDSISIPAQYHLDIDIEFSSDGETFAPYTGAEDETFQRITVTVLREGSKPVLSVCTYRTK
ncbi:hypothetical protein ACFLSK_03840 [Chloroflexota bacterium]